MFTVGNNQDFTVDDELALLAAFESLVGTCLEIGNVFAIIEHEHHFVQLALDPEHGMEIETTVEGSAEHAGFRNDVPGFEGMSAAFLPASWHAREKIVASAFTRSLVAGLRPNFPATFTATILPTGRDKPHEEAPASPPYTEGAPSVGFLFGADGPRGEFVEEFGPALGVDSQWSEAVVNAVQSKVEAELGPLNRAERAYDADVVVVLGGEAPPCRPQELWGRVVDGVFRLERLDGDLGV